MWRTLVYLFGLSVLLTACGKENQPEIPYVFVDRIYYPNSLDYIPAGGFIYKNEGYRGIIIYRVMNDDFRVYERCCPYDPEKSNAKVQVESSGMLVVDSVCMSRYVITDGSPFSGPSPYVLKQYRWSYDGETLHVYN